MSQGRTIRLFLVDGEPTGILTAEIMNWTGKLLVAPRSQLASLAKREEVKRTGVYLLVGPDPEDTTRECVYVGEGDNVLSRLTTHDKDVAKDFWTRCIVVISKDENLTKSHGRYLESHLITRAKTAGRAKVFNGTGPAVPPMPEADCADMDFYIGQISLILPVLGFSFLKQPVAANGSAPGNGPPSPRLVMKEGKKQAYAQEMDGEFVVLADSPAKKHPAASWTSYRGLRDALVKEGKLVDGADPDYYRFAENVPFNSPSAAAATVAAGNRNGRTYWKIEATGQTYAEWKESQVEMSDTEQEE